MITVRQEIRPEDYRRAVYLHLRPRPVFAVAGILMLALAVLALVLMIRSHPPWDPITLVLPGCLAYFAVYFFVMIPWQANKQFKQNRFLAHVAEFRIDAAGLRSQSDLGSMEIPWDHLHKWKESQRLILLYPTDATYLIFPRRLFAPAEWEEFRALTAQHLKKIR